MVCTEGNNVLSALAANSSKRTKIFFHSGGPFPWEVWWGVKCRINYQATQSCLTRHRFFQNKALINTS